MAIVLHIVLFANTMLIWFYQYQRTSYQCTLSALESISESPVLRMF